MLNKTFEAARNAGRKLAMVNDSTIKDVLLAVSDAALAKKGLILVENRQDLDRMDPNDPKYDRLKLTEKKVE